jgi:hypothetical protein
MFPNIMYVAILVVSMSFNGGAGRKADIQTFSQVVVPFSSCEKLKLSFDEAVEKYHQQLGIQTAGAQCLLFGVVAPTEKDGIRTP